MDAALALCALLQHCLLIILQYCLLTVCEDCVPPTALTPRAVRPARTTAYRRRMTRHTIARDMLSFTLFLVKLDERGDRVVRHLSTWDTALATLHFARLSVLQRCAVLV